MTHQQGQQLIQPKVRKLLDLKTNLDESLLSVEPFSWSLWNHSLLWSMLIRKELMRRDDPSF